MVASTSSATKNKIKKYNMAAISILVVDDERAIRNSLKEILEYENYKVEVAENGADALSKVQNGKFDLIFVDQPYDAGLYKTVLEKINSIDILSEGGIIIVEADRDCALPEMAPPYHRLRENRYGKVKICTNTKESAV